MPVKAREPSEPRLGKIEKFLLWYVARQRKRKNDFVGRWSAMSAYVRLGRSRDYPSGSNSIRDLKQTINDPSSYKSLQATFTRALRALERKAYVQTVRLETGVVVDSALEVIPKEAYDALADFLGIRSPIHASMRKNLSEHSRTMRPDWAEIHGRTAQNRVVYRLTEGGWRRARALKDAW
jgi:hypothetical protein